MGLKNLQLASSIRKVYTLWAPAIAAAAMFTCFLILVSAFGLWGQSEIASSTLLGTVYDESAAVVPEATITVVDDSVAASREVQSGPTGEYRVLNLRPGNYTVRVTRPGFRPQVIRDVRLTVGQSFPLDATLTTDVVETSLEVSATSPLVETERTQQSDTIELQRISQLPINRRNFLDFALQTPGVTDSSSMVDDTQFRISQTPNSGLSFAGNNGRGNFVSIDGAANVYNTGGVRPTISQSAVQEFQINRSTVSAEFGGGSGGIVNIISRSGTNALHGELFGFLRHRSFQARNYFDEEKTPFTRSQAGVAAGGPVRRDRTFFFASFERLDRHESARVPILSRDPSVFTRLTSTQSLLFNHLDGLAAAPDTDPLRELAAHVRPALLATSYPDTISLFQQNSGVFPFGEAQTQGSAKIDHSFSSNHSAFLRGNWTDNLSDNTEFGSLIAFSRGRTIDQFDNTWALSDTYILSPQTIHQFRFTWGYNRLSVSPTDSLGPELNITSYGFFGRDALLPSRNVERQYQLQDNLTHVTGTHTLKMGMEYLGIRDHFISETLFGGRFGFGENFPLMSVLAASGGHQAVAGLNQYLLAAPGVPAGLRSSVSAVLPGTTAAVPVSVALVAPVTALQAFNLGVPSFYQQSFGDPAFLAWAHRFGFFVQDNWKVKRNLVLNLGLRHEVHAEAQPIGTHFKNFGPRIGLSWDPFSDAKMVVRTGYGIYFSPVDHQIVNVVNNFSGDKIHQLFVPLSGIPGALNPQTGVPLTSANIYQTLRAQGILGAREIQEADLRQFGITPGPGAPFSALFRASPDYTIPYGQQVSFGVDRQVGHELSVSANYLFSRATRIPRRVDINVLRAGTNPSNGQPLFAFRDPLLLQLNQYESTANAFYHGMVISVSRRLGSSSSFQGHYTFSKAIDEVTDFNYEPNDQTNLRAERGLSSFDQRHRFVASGVFAMPAGSSAGEGLLARSLEDITVAPSFLATSGRPFNLLTGFDNYGDRHPVHHRPFGVGRNIGKGPMLVTLDLRVSRLVRLRSSERMRLEFIAEVFNLFNQTNFRSVNNTVGNVRLAGRDLIDPATGDSINDGLLQGRRDRLPTQPLGFTSAFDPRQFQFGTKLLF